MAIDKKKSPGGGETIQGKSQNATDNIAETKPKGKVSDQKKSNGQGRTRNYGCVVYPESAPENWQDILAEQFVPAFINLHDRDIDPQNQPKKPHYHVLLMFDSVKTTDQAREIFDKIGGVGCEVVNSIRGYARYLCHLDNPEKAQYDPNDVRSFCGADYQTIIGLVSDKYKAIRDMRAWCKANDIYTYADLFDYAADNNEGWFRILCDSGTIVMKEYLRSRDWHRRQPPMDSTPKWRVDLGTGEVLEDEPGAVGDAKADE